MAAGGPPVHLRPADPRRPDRPGRPRRPYHFGSRIRPGYDRDGQVHARLEAALAQLLPPAAGARITYRRGVPLGIPRDWTASVGLDRATGLAWAGGYVGDGVAAANLAGRILADLICGNDSDLTRLPGSSTALGPGSPSRCDGWASTPAAGWPAPPTINRDWYVH